MERKPSVFTGFLAVMLISCSPAGTPEVRKPLTPQQISQLRAFLTSPKFAPDNDYVGFLSKDVVEDPEALINEIPRGLLADGQYTKESVLSASVKQLEKYRLADTEDRERAGKAVERLMDILEIESSDGRLSEAIYGVSTDSTEP